MKIQVLVAAMNQNDFLLPEKMNLKTDAIIGNQCKENKIETIIYKKNTIKYLSFSERGVGLNRNNALMRASGDISLFSDEDMTYKDDYPEIVKNAFAKLPHADAIIFNINTIGKNIERRKNEKIKKVSWYNALNYGAARLAVKTSSIKREGICFNQCFGGGTLFSSGEDTLFICEMLRKKLKIYVYPETIGSVVQDDSTWFKGYNKKYYYDKGVLFKSISKPFAKLLCLQDLIRHPYYKQENLSFKDALKSMFSGIKAQKNLIPYKD